jgi:hypothetical protein
MGQLCCHCVVGEALQGECEEGEFSYLLSCREGVELVFVSQEFLCPEVGMFLHSSEVDLFLHSKRALNFSNSRDGGAHEVGHSHEEQEDAGRYLHVGSRTVSKVGEGSQEGCLDIEIIHLSGLPSVFLAPGSCIFPQSVLYYLFFPC